MYFAEGQLGAIRINDFKYIDQPGGWLGGTVKPYWPIMVNLRLDPFERTGMAGSVSYFDWMKYNIWRFVFVQEVVVRVADTFIDFPPMQRAASFNLEALKAQVVEKARGHKVAV